MDVQLGKLLLKKANFNANLKQHSETLMFSIKTKNSPPPSGQKYHCRPYAEIPYLEQILKLVDAETQFSHARLEQFPQTVLLHQTHKNTKRLLFWHLQEEQRCAEFVKYQFC